MAPPVAMAVILNAYTLPGASRQGGMVNVRSVVRRVARSDDCVESSITLTA
jgi:hypothetical protein